MRLLHDEENLASSAGALSDTALRRRGPVDEGATAVIWRAGKSVTSSAPQSRRPWQLTFERRRPLDVEPLMGWTTDADPLVQVRLSFPTLQSAVAYARRQGLNYRIRVSSDEFGQGSPMSPGPTRR